MQSESMRPTSQQTRRALFVCQGNLVMLNLSPKYLLIVKQPRGLIVRDTPRPESEGSIRLRTEPVGKQLQAYDIHNIGGVSYARLIPQILTKPEWVRVREADGSVEYVDVIELEGEVNSLADAVRYLADTIARTFSNR
jgi:hypothetical protein